MALWDIHVAATDSHYQWRLPPVEFDLQWLTRSTLIWWCYLHQRIPTLYHIFAAMLAWDQSNSQPKIWPFWATCCITLTNWHDWGKNSMQNLNFPGSECNGVASFWTAQVIHAINTIDLHTAVKRRTAARLRDVLWALVGDCLSRTRKAWMRQNHGGALLMLLTYYDCWDLKCMKVQLSPEDKWSAAIYAQLPGSLVA